MLECLNYRDKTEMLFSVSRIFIDSVELNSDYLISNMWRP